MIISSILVEGQNFPPKNLVYKFLSPPIREKENIQGVYLYVLRVLWENLKIQVGTGGTQIELVCRVLIIIFKIPA